MKILTYKADGNTAIAKNKELTQARDNIWFSITTDDYGQNIYHYYLRCKNDICYPLGWARQPADIENIEKLKNDNEADILQDIKDAMEHKTFVSTLDILFCELMQESELASACKAYHDAWIERSRKQDEIERKAREEKEERERQERERAKREKDAADLQHAYDALKGTDKVEWTAREFELLCKDNNITIPLRTLGYLQKNVVKLYLEYMTPQTLSGKQSTEKVLTAGYSHKGKNESKKLYSIIFEINKKLWHGGKQ